MNTYIPRGEFRDTNTSAVLAVYRILRRQPWKTMAITTWDHMRRFLHLALLATSLGALLPTLAQARLYDVVSSDVPFKFQIGERTSSQDTMTLFWPRRELWPCAIHTDALLPTSQPGPGHLANWQPPPSWSLTRIQKPHS